MRQRRYDILNEIERLDPQADHVRIYHLTVGYEFPWDMTRALEVALYRTFAVPSISGLLAATGEFVRRGQKRYDDTSLIISDISEHGYNSEIGRAAIRRMNRIHGQYSISNDDFLYVLSTFIFEPVRWMDRFGWRPMSQNERLASYYFWREVGRRMAIRDIPSSYEAFERFMQDYERQHYVYSDDNNGIARASLEVFASWVPQPLAPAVRSAIKALLDDSTLAAFGFARPSPVIRKAMTFGLALRGRIVRWLPPRSEPDFLGNRRNRTYPDGYAIEDLGPPDFVAREQQRRRE